MTADSSTTLDDVYRRSWEQNKLFSVLLELTYRCNLDCVFCYNDVGLKGLPLTRERYFDLFAELAALQVFNLTLSGGEPLAHPDFFALGVRARDLGFMVRVKSNGHALRREVAERLRAEVDPFMVEVSLHGASAAVHDRQTRVAGSFDRLLDNLRGMRDIGLRLKLNSTLTAWNEHEIDGMYAIADALDVALQIDSSVTPRDDGDRSPMEISPTRDGVLALFRAQRRRSGDGDKMSATDPSVRVASAPTKHCGAGSSGIAIDPVGNIYPCVQWRRPIGNLHTTTVTDLWRCSRELDDVRRLTVDLKRSLDAAYAEDAPLLQFCPGEAVAHSGDAFALYPAARERLTATKAVIGGAQLEVHGVTARAPAARRHLPLVG